MARFWLDANVFIRPQREGFYGLRLAPSFWRLIEDRSALGTLASPRQVFVELANFMDELSAWANERRDSGLFVDPSQEDQENLTKVADYVNQNYPGRKAAEFLGGADPWVIAHAITDAGIIVSFESRVSIDSQTPKVPNVAQAFHIETITLYRMLQLLNTSIEFS